MNELVREKLLFLTGRTDGTVNDLLYAFLREQTSIRADTIPDMWDAIREANGLPLGYSPFQWLLDTDFDGDSPPENINKA